MLKKTITFSDLDGNSITDDFYFHMSKAELVEWQLGKNGGMEDYLRMIVATKDTALIISTFKDILLKSYGVRSADGRSFLKSEQASREFEGTEAYSNLFIELVTNAQAGAEFINGIVPKDLSDKLKSKTVSVDLPATPAEVPPFKMPETPPSKNLLVGPRDPSTMSREELIEAFQNEVRRSGD